MRAFRSICSLAAVLLGCSTTTTPGSQGDRDSATPQGDTAADPGDGGSEASPADARDTASDAIAPESSTGVGDFVGSIVWDVAQGDQFDLVVNFVVGVRTAGPSGVQPTCAGGTQVGSCCFQKASSGGPSGADSDGGAQATSPARATGSAAAMAARDVCPRFGDPPDNNAEAGVLSFSDNGKITGQGIRDPQTGYHYKPTNGAPLRWDGGDELSVAIPGGPCIPAVSGKIRAVAPLIAIPPETIRIDQGFTMQWTPDPNADKVRISFSGTPRGGGVGLCECAVADATGKLVVPAAITQLFEPSPSVVSIVTVHRSSERQVGPNISLRSDFNFIVPTHLQ